MSEGTRLNKYLAACGVGSRRACDVLVQEGHVEINGKPVLNPAERVEPGDFVRVDGKRVTPKETGVVAFHKPRGLVCSREDELGRETIYEALPVSLHHFHHVGRLDRDSEGLLILTNDGAMSQKMLHPSKSVEKEYLVTANQPILQEHLDLFLSGVYVEKDKMKAKDVERLSSRRVRIILDTGLKRQIRMMFLTLGYQVEKLVRIRIGSFELTDLPLGRWRPLDPKEIESLLINPKRKAKAKPARRPAKKAAAKKTAGRKTAVRGRGTAAARRAAEDDSLPPSSTRRHRQRPENKGSARKSASSGPRRPAKKAAKSAKRAPRRKF